jgi:hypothetical protein
MCGEARAGRKTLIPLVALSVMLVVVSVTQAVLVGREKERDVADMRVAKLRQREGMGRVRVMGVWGKRDDY